MALSKLYEFYLICCCPRVPFSIQNAKLFEEVLLWLFPLSPLFCVIFPPGELPSNPLWPCTNSSLHDTIEQSGHLTSVSPSSACSLHPPLLPPSTMASRTMRGIDVSGATHVLVHMHMKWCRCHRRESHPKPPPMTDDARHTPSFIVSVQ